MTHAVTDDLRFLNTSLTAADQARQLLALVNVDRAANPTETWLYAPFDTRVQDILVWSAGTVASGRSGVSGEKRELLVQRGNELLARLGLGFEQLESEHRYYVAELKRQLDYVREASLTITTLGTIASLALFAFVLLRVNHLIGERDRARQVLSESEQQYRTLADSGQAMIWTAGTDALCNYFNRVWLEFTGRPLEQELGNGWAEGVHSDDVQQCLDIYLHAFEKRDKFSMDYRLRRHDGSYRWLQDDGCPRYDSEGRFLGYIGYCLDVTERKRANEALRESELRFRTLLDGISSVAIQCYGADLVTNYWNPASAELYGYTTDEALGRKLTDLIIPSAMVGEVERAVAGMLSSGQPTPTGELTLRHKDGGPVHVISGHAVVNVSGQDPVLFCVDVDIGERKRVESELQKYRDHLEERIRDCTREERALDGDDVVSAWLRATVRSLRDACRLVLAVGTADFHRISKELYGGPRSRFHASRNMMQPTPRVNR